ncbi:MAG: tetratricopeptide repeat protein [bacterium]
MDHKDTFFDKTPAFHFFNTFALFKIFILVNSLSRKAILLILLGFFSWFNLLQGQVEMNPRQAGVNLLRNGQFIEALDKINQALALEPASADLFFLRGYAKYSLDDYFGAEHDFTTSIDLSPFNSNAFNFRAVVRSQLSNYKGAFDDFAKALEIDTANAEVYVNRARTNLFLKMYYSCLMDCSKAIRLKYPSETVYILKGSAELAIGRFDNAIASLRKGIEMNPDDPYCYIQQGLVYLELVKYDSAIYDFSKAISIDSLNTYAMFNRALAYTKIKEEKKALLDLNRVIIISPYNSYAYYNRAIILIGMGDKVGAIRDFTYVSKLDPRNIISYYYRSRLKSELKDYQGALQDLDKTIELFPDYADAYYERFEVKMKLKDRNGAQEDYERASMLGKQNSAGSDSLMKKKEDYLQSLVKLSGDFEEMNTLNSKFQNQYVEIELLPMFRQFYGKADYDKIYIYDAYQKPHYAQNLLMFSNRNELIHDSLSGRENEARILRMDSIASTPDSYNKIALQFSSTGNYDMAFNLYRMALALDSNFIMACFDRAYCRHELIHLLQSQENYQEQITIGKSLSQGQNKIKATEMEHTYEMVITDLNKVILLDSVFSFAYYNKGYIESKMGNYREAVENFSSAIRHKVNFSEAYYNRGLIYILLNERQKGCEDLSRAGELGILDAYRVMKRYCYK